MPDTTPEHYVQMLNERERTIARMAERIVELNKALLRAADWLDAEDRKQRNPPPRVVTGLADGARHLRDIVRNDFS